MTYLSSSYGTFTPGGLTEGVLFYRPRGFRADGTQRAVVFLTGAGGNAVTVQGSAFRHLPQALADLGVPVVSIDCANNVATAAAYAWGNDIAATRIEYVRATVLPALGLKNDKLALLAGSAGFTNACQYARQFPATTAAIAGHVALVDLTGFRNANLGGFQSAIDTQYGGSGPFAAAAPTHSPLAFAATIQAASYPVKGWWSSDDPFILPATVDAFVAAAPRVQRVDVGAQGHAIPASHNADTSAFLLAALA